MYFLGLILAVIRIGIAVTVGMPPADALWFQCYKDAAYLYMGWLACTANTDFPIKSVFTWKFWRGAPTPLWKLFWFMSILETTVAVLSRVL